MAGNTTGGLFGEDVGAVAAPSGSGNSANIVAGKTTGWGFGGDDGAVGTGGVVRDAAGTISGGLLEGSTPAIAGQRGDSVIRVAG